MQKFAVIVDPFSSGALYAEALRARGITPIAVLSREPILSIYQASFKPADFAFQFSYKGDEQLLLHELQSFFENDRPLFILPGTECGVELADKLANHFCPATANSMILSSCRRNKYDMSRQLSRSAISIPLAIKSNSVDEVLNWSRQHQLLPHGVVIKPLASAGTDSVYACFSENEIIAAMKNNLGKFNQFNYKNEMLLAQEFLSGTEYVIDTASFRGKHIVTTFCQYKKIQLNGAHFIYDYVDFMPAHGDRQKELAEYIFKVLDGLEIQYGPAHSEVMYTARGPRLIETGARLHGGVGVMASRLASGTSQLERSMDFLMGDAAPTINKIDFQLRKHTRIVFLISHFESRIQNENANIKMIKDLPSFITMRLNVNPNGFIKKTVDFFTTPGLLILSHPSAEQVEEDYQIIRALEQEGLFHLYNECLT